MPYSTNHSFEIVLHLLNRFLKLDCQKLQLTTQVSLVRFTRLTRFTSQPSWNLIITFSLHCRLMILQKICNLSSQKSRRWIISTWWYVTRDMCCRSRRRYPRFSQESWELSAGTSDWAISSERVLHLPPETFSTGDVVAAKDGELSGETLAELAGKLLHLNL